MRPEGHGVTTAVKALVLVCAVACAVLGASACAERRTDSGELALTGTVLDDRIDLQVPALPTPVLNVTAGMRPAPSAAGTATASTLAAIQTGTSGPSGGPGTAQAGSPTQYARVASAPVEPGDTVQAGDVLVVFDQAPLEAAVNSAEAAADAASSSVGVIDARLGSAAERASDLASQTTAVQQSITDLTTTRLTLTSQLAAAQAALAALDTPPPSMPTTPPPGAPTPEQIAAQRAQLEAAVASMTAGIAKIDEGLTTAQEGLVKLQEGGTKLTDAQTLLYDLRDLASIASEVASLGVDVARAQLDRATVRAPEPGTVVEIAAVGDVLAAGAPVAALRRQTSQQIETWVDVSEADRVVLGQAATVAIDSRPGETFWGRVTLVDAQTGFPPTSHATDIVHMIRAVRIRVGLDDATTLPAGTPADVTISTR